MAQKTSELWKQLLDASDTIKEYGFEINGVWYGPEAEASHSVSNNIYEEFGIGNTASATLDLELYANDIPKAATIKRFVRLVNDGQASEWIQKGVFFTNRRAVNDGFWTIEAVDAMRKADKPYLPVVDAGEWPRSMKDVVQEIANIIGVSIDERTHLNDFYKLQYPAEYTMRDILGHVAAAHGGNWVITDLGELLLIPLFSIPEETNYLVTKKGAAITFGGVRLLV